MGRVGSREWAAQAWPGYDWSAATSGSGAFHEVLLCAPRVAARVATGAGHRERVVREAAVMRVVAGLDLGFTVPRLLGVVVTHGDRTGMLTSFVPGEARPASSWLEARASFAAMLSAFAAVPEQVGTQLAPPRSWCGGTSWPDVVDELGAALPGELRARAAHVVADVLALEVTPGFVHGDLGLHNVLWTGDSVTGLLDTDNACWGDPAMDVAPLIGAFGSAAVATLVPAALLHRAMYHRASLSLQVAAAAQLIGDTALRDHALGNFAARAGAGTLYDPDGAEPPR